MARTPGPHSFFICSQFLKIPIDWVDCLEWGLLIQEAQDIFSQSRESAMRDIRADLRDRLTSLDARMSELVREYNREKAELDKRFSEHERSLDDERKAASALLMIEERRYGEAETAEIKIPTQPLADFLIAHAKKHGPTPKEELRNAAALSGYFPDGEGGRTIHTTLLNLVRAGRLIETAEGRYLDPMHLDLDMNFKEGQEATT